MRLRGCIDIYQEQLEEPNRRRRPQSPESASASPQPVARTDMADMGSLHEDRIAVRPTFYSSSVRDGSYAAISTVQLRRDRKCLVKPPKIYCFSRDRE